MVLLMIQTKYIQQMKRNSRAEVVIKPLMAGRFPFHLIKDKIAATYKPGSSTGFPGLTLDKTLPYPQI